MRDVRDTYKTNAGSWRQISSGTRHRNIRFLNEREYDYG